jgi:hypothetical protein
MGLTLATMGLAALLLGGCVSSKKYKSSQATLQRVRDDSTRQAQQIASLNDNVQTLQTKNSALQRSLDSSSNSNAAQQKTITGYANYFKQQQDAISQVSGDMKGALSQAGLSGDDVQQDNNTVYIRLDEEKIFRKNSAAVTSSGKQALNNLARVISNRSDINVFVSNGDSSGSASEGPGMAASSSNASSSSGSEVSDEPVRHRTHHHMTAAHRSSTAGSTQSSGTGGSASSQSAASQGTTVHKKVYHHHPHAEGSMTIYNSGRKYPASHYWALKQARMGTVANEFLQNGVPKVNVSLEKPAANGTPQSRNIRVIITPMPTTYPNNSSASVQ